MARRCSRWAPADLERSALSSSTWTSNCRNGRSLAVRLQHRVAFGQDGAPGASRTLVLNRAPGEQSEENLRAAEESLRDLFNSTPMAIATLDENGRGSTFQRSLCATVCPGAPKRGWRSRKARARLPIACRGMSERDRAP